MYSIWLKYQMEWYELWDDGPSICKLYSIYWLIIIPRQHLYRHKRRCVMPTSVSHEYTSLSDLCSLLAYTDQHYWSVYAQLACNSHICHSAWSLTSREVMATVHACNSVPQNHPIYQYTKNGPWLAHINSSLTLSVRLQKLCAWWCSA